MALVFPSYALAGRPNIDRVVVGRDSAGLLTFRILFAEPVVDAPDTVQVAIDADRDSGTGVDGLDYSLDKSDAFVFDFPETLSLLTAVNGEPVASHPRTLTFRQEGVLWKGGVSSATFSIPAAAIGDPRRLDFYAFIESDGALDEAPSHVLVSAGSLPWTYPKHDEPGAGAAYPVETYRDGSDITLHERPGVVIGVVAAIALGIGALIAAIVWTERRRRMSQRPAASRI